MGGGGRKVKKSRRDVTALNALPLNHSMPELCHTLAIYKGSSQSSPLVAGRITFNRCRLDHKAVSENRDGKAMYSIT